MKRPSMKRPGTSQRASYACGSGEHVLARRSFLGGIAAGIAASGSAACGWGIRRAAAAEIAAAGKRVLVIDLHGGVSQLESWDPKPKTDTGGPFRAIPTAVPGIHICELLPHTAQQMHHLALVRSVNTNENDHGKGRYIMETGRRQEPAVQFPHLGSVAARYLSPEDNPLPGYIHVASGGSGVGGREAAFLGPRFASMTVSAAEPPTNSKLPGEMTTEADLRRQELRRRANQRFLARRKSAEIDAYTYSYDQAAQLMARREIFDLSQEPQSDVDRYGTHDFGKQCLLARRLLEHDVTFVKVSHSNYDTHNENFNFHIEQLGEFDRTFASLVGDLAERGMLENTLVAVISEFGRTPRINHQYGRDHWSAAWSVALGGCGIHGGAVIGKTNANGTEVADRQVHGGHLFHTYLSALGVDPHDDYIVDGRPIPKADPEASAIEELFT